MEQHNEIMNLTKIVEGSIQDEYLKAEMKSVTTKAEKMYARYRSKGMHRAADTLLADMTKYVGLFLNLKKTREH